MMGLSKRGFRHSRRCELHRSSAWHAFGLAVASALLASIVVACPAVAGPASGGSADPSLIELRIDQGKSQTKQVVLSLDKKPIQRVDVLFVFDVTGSMGEELSAAKDQGKALMQYILDEVAPDSQFGVASFCDYPGDFSSAGYSDTYGGPSDYPWAVNQSVTGKIDAVDSAIGDLSIQNGQDGPEDYARVYDECVRDGSIKWRAGAKRVVIVFGDAPPHDANFGGRNTGVDPGRDATVGTSDDVDFEAAVKRLASNSTAVLTVDCGSSSDAKEAFDYVSKQTKGQSASLSDSKNLKKTVSAIVRKETAVVDRLVVKVDGPKKAWVKVDPASITAMPGGSARTFGVKVTVPAGSPQGTSDAMVHFVADGYEISATQINIIVKGPPKPTNFDPKTDGWGFKNVGSSASWESFESYFGTSNIVSKSGKPYYAAAKAYDHWRKAGDGGSCYGFSASSMAIHAGRITYPGVPAKSLSKIREPKLDKEKLASEAPGPLIAEYQARLIDVRYQVAVDAVLMRDTNTVLQGIKDYIDQGHPVSIYISHYDMAEPDIKKRWSAHAVVATDYKRGKTDEETLVRVYDSNHPKNGNRWIKFNTSEHSWVYNLSGKTWWSYRNGNQEWSASAGKWGKGAWVAMSDEAIAEITDKSIGKTSSLIGYAPIDVAIGPGVPAWNPSKASMEGWGTVDKKDSLCFIDLDDAFPEKLMSDGGSVQWRGPAAFTTSTVSPTQSMYVGRNVGSLQFDLVPSGAATGSVSVFSEGTYTGVTLDAGAALETSIAPSGAAELAGANSATATYSYSVSREASGSSHAIEIDGVGAGAVGDRLTPSADLADLQLVKGSTSTYNVRVLSIAEKDVAYGANGVSVSAGDRHTVSVADWGSFDTTPPVVAIDRGNDGSIDETVTLTPLIIGGGGAGGGAGDAGMFVVLLGATLAGGLGWAIYSAQAPPADAATPLAEPRYGSAAAVARLESLSGEPTYYLHVGSNLVGRGPDCDVILMDPTASRRHATIVVGERAGSIRDEGSSGGTWVNGLNVTATELVDGDVLRFGDSEFSFRTMSAG